MVNNLVAIIQAVHHVEIVLNMLADDLILDDPVCSHITIFPHKQVLIGDTVIR